MQVSTNVARRRFLGTLVSGGSFVVWSLAGCGSNESTVEMTDEAKKAIRASKVGDESKFKKPGRVPGRR